MSNQENATESPQANREQLDTILLNFYIEAKNDGVIPYSQSTKNKAKDLLLAWNKATVIEELEKLRDSPSVPPDCKQTCKSKHWHHVMVGNINHAITELSKEQADE